MPKKSIWAYQGRDEGIFCALQIHAVENAAGFEVFEIQSTVFIEEVGVGCVLFGQRDGTAVGVDESLLRFAKAGGVEMPV